MAVVLAAALVGAAVAAKLRQSMILGYLAMGVILGWLAKDYLTPTYGIQIVGNESVSILSDLGVAFLLFFVGLAYWLDHWIFVLWAVAALPIWYLGAVHEEKLMRRDYPAYEDYARRTRRFIPGLW